MIEFIDKTSEIPGTPINRKNLMALQGFKNQTTEIDEKNGIVVVTDNDNGHKLTVVITKNEDGSITIAESFVGEKTITKTTNINSQGTIVNEVLT